MKKQYLNGFSSKFYLHMSLYQVKDYRSIMLCAQESYRTRAIYVALPQLQCSTLGALDSSQEAQYLKLLVSRHAQE